MKHPVVLVAFRVFRGSSPRRSPAAGSIVAPTPESAGGSMGGLWSGFESGKRDSLFWQSGTGGGGGDM